jgi:hypothetical protein
MTTTLRVAEDVAVQIGTGGTGGLTGMAIHGGDVKMGKASRGRKPPE